MGVLPLVLWSHQTSYMRNMEHGMDRQAQHFGVMANTRSCVKVKSPPMIGNGGCEKAKAKQFNNVLVWDGR